MLPVCCETISHRLLPSLNNSLSTPHTHKMMDSETQNDIEEKNGRKNEEKFALARCWWNVRANFRHVTRPQKPETNQIQDVSRDIRFVFIFLLR